MNLQYKTNGMSDPKGKPKVYFSCHPADFAAAFPLITEDILKHANCAIWYDTELDAQVDEKELEETLREMQLVVFAVTSRFLHENHRAKDLELGIALRNHIPVLPIMLENGLGYEFSNTCAKIQVVPKYVKDPTATPYDEVLKTFLSSVLVGDELAEKVRNAFDAYVFLSYRKKDRRHAQRLMRLIHKNEQFRDIAIWYDEFLVPGERFNEAIADAFEKSSLFAMAVTPHLEEEGNYVMRVEYPMARDREKKNKDEHKEGFVIVPVEMYEEDDEEEGKDWRIDPSELKNHGEFKYRDIPDLRDEHRPVEMNRTFRDALERIAKKENDGSSQHRFFIGLAYLNGIDMEINQKRALDLIVDAALDSEPCMEATAKLVDMYLNGEGVPASRAVAICWQELLADQYKRAYDRNHDPDEHKGYGTAYFKALRKLSDLYGDAGKTQIALETAKRAFSFCVELEQEVGIREQQRDKALILNRLGSLYLEIGDKTSAEDCFAKACRIYEKQVSEISTERARRDLSIAYERLGDVCRKRKDLAGAEKYFTKAEVLRRQLLEEVPGAGSRRDLSAILTKLGNVWKSAKEYVRAGKYYGEALSIDRVLAEEVKSPQAWDDYGVSLVKIGDIHKAEGRLTESADGYTKAYGIFEKNEKETGSRIFLDHKAGGAEKLASVKKKLGENEEAGKLYEEAIELREQLYEASRTVTSAHALAVAYYNAAVFSGDSKRMRRAYEIWSILSESYPEYAEYRDKAKKKL